MPLDLILRRRPELSYYTNSRNDIDDIGFHILDQRYELQTVRKLVKIPPELLGDYVGKYQLRPGFIITVTTENEKLMVQATGQPKFEVYPETETKFFLTVVDAQITFLRDDNGEVNRLMLHQGGAELVGKKSRSIRRFLITMLESTSFKAALYSM